MREQSSQSDAKVGVSLFKIRKHSVGHASPAEKPEGSKIDLKACALARFTARARVFYTELPATYEQTFYLPVGDGNPHFCGTGEAFLR